jgi:hypothetical protein
MNARMLICASGIALAGALAAIEPAQAALTLIAVGGGGGGDGFLPGANGAGGVISESGTSGGTGGGAGGIGGLGGAGTDAAGGGAGWLGNGGNGVTGGGGSSAPTFAGGVGLNGNGGDVGGAGGFGGGGGSGFDGGGGGGGFSGGGASDSGSFGGGGSYLNPAMRDTIETPDFNGVPGPQFPGSNSGIPSNGYVIVGLTVFNYTGTVVEYTIPTTGFYFVAAVGAQGGSGFLTGGFGAGVGGSVFLDMGTELDIVVGGAGFDDFGTQLLGGGGGGSFVWDPVALPTQPAVTAAVPEPSTWAMMLIGFGGLGVLGWRGSRKTAARSA